MGERDSPAGLHYKEPSITTQATQYLLSYIYKSGQVTQIFAADIRGDAKALSIGWAVQCCSQWGCSPSRIQLSRTQRNLSFPWDAGWRLQVASSAGRGAAASPRSWHWPMGTLLAPGATPGTVSPLWSGGKGTVSTDYGTVDGVEDTCPHRNRLSHQPMFLQPSKKS